VGDTFYYITNSQIDHFQNGKVLHPETLAPIVVAKVELKWFLGALPRLRGR
jgi:hypothetical protein